VTNITLHRHLQSIGCFATIVAIGFGPSLQNLIHCYPNTVVNSAQQAYITSSSSYTLHGDLGHGSLLLGFKDLGETSEVTADDSIEFSLNPVLKLNVYSSIFNSDASQPWATPQYTCGSGNCAFEPIITIAARARCHNLTDMLHTRCGVTNNCTVSVGLIDDQGLSLSYRLSIGGQFVAIGTAANLSTPHASNSNSWNRVPIIQYIMVKDFNRVLRNFDFDVAARLDTPFLAAECEIVIGVQAVQDSIKNAKHSAEDIGFWRYGDPVTITTSNATLAAWWRNLTGQWDSVPKEDLSISQGITSPGMFALPPGYEIRIFTIDALTTFIRSVFIGTFSASSEGLPLFAAEGDYADAAIDITQSVFQGNISGCADSDDHLPCGVENMAKAMTKSFRDSSANVTYGETQVVISYVRTNWFWFSPPLSVWAMAAVLWTSTVIHTRRMRVSAWANNILPLLFWYRGDIGKGEVGQQGCSNADYLRRSERIAVKLRFPDGKAKFE
jgi:hypothetical protein